MSGNPNESIAIPAPPPPKKKGNFVVIFILLILISGFLSLIVFLQPKQIKQQLSASSPETTLIATIGRDEIFLEDVKGYARQQYQENAITNDVLKISLDALIEERLLEKTGEEEEISVTEQEINEGLKEDGIDIATANKIQRKIARLAVLKQKIKIRFAKTRTAYTIGFWIAPENYQGATVSKEVMARMDQQRKDALPALAEIEKQLKQGGEPLTIAQDIVKKYPSLKNIMAVNGYFLKYPENEIYMKEPSIYTAKETQKDGSEDSTLYNTLFSLRIGQIALARDASKDEGGFVVKVIAVSDGPYEDYGAWLAAKRQELVKIHTQL